MMLAYQQTLRSRRSRASRLNALPTSPVLLPRDRYFENRIQNQPVPDRALLHWAALLGPLPWNCPVDL